MGKNTPKRTILDRIEKIMNKRQKIDFNAIATLHGLDWTEAEDMAKNIFLKPGWAVFYVRDEGFIDHISIVPAYESEFPLNLLNTPLLHVTPPPIGLGVGPLTNDVFDQSGTRVCTAFEFIESYKNRHSYKKIFFGPPPTFSELLLEEAGKIANAVAKSGLLDGKPIVFSFGMLPVIKKFFISFFDTSKQKAKIIPIKRLHQSVIPLYCGGLVGEIWKRAGIKNIPEIKFLKMRGSSSFSIFKWCYDYGTIKTGLSWE